MAGPGPWEEGGRGKVNLPECSNTHDRVGGFILDLEFFRPMAITHEKTRSEKATYSTGVE